MMDGNDGAYNDKSEMVKANQSLPRKSPSYSDLARRDFNFLSKIR